MCKQSKRRSILHNKPTNILLENSQIFALVELSLEFIPDSSCSEYERKDSFHYKVVLILW